jgi:hypothetical protein
MILVSQLVLWILTQFFVCGFFADEDIPCIAGARDKRQGVNEAGGYLVSCIWSLVSRRFFDNL